MSGERLNFSRRAGGVPYSLVEGYPRFSFSDDSNTGEEQYIIHKFNMTALHRISMPPPIIFNDTVNTPPRRGMPGSPSLRTKSMDFEPLKQDLPQDPFGIFGEFGYDNDFMRVTIKYQTNKIDEEEGDQEDPITFLEMGFDTTADILKIPCTRTNFIGRKSSSGSTGGSQGSGNGETGSENTDEEVNVDNDIPATVVVPTTTYTLNWKFALNPNFNLFRSLIGRVNQMTDPLFFNAPKETILFTGFSGKRSFLWDGENTTVTPWDLNMKFVGKHIEYSKGVLGASVGGWNHVYRPSTGKFERIRKADGSFLYQSTSTWSQMFRSGGLDLP